MSWRDDASNRRSTSSLTIRVAARGHRHVCADQTEQQDGTFECFASTFSSDAHFHKDTI
jgi:hypothetical protein